jgi:hypothetical protein
MKMNNLSFKNYHEMNAAQLLDYVGELEVRVNNAENGARLFKDEAAITRTELLKWREIAKQNKDHIGYMAFFFERHIEALLAVAVSSQECALEEADHVSFVRLLRFMLSVVLKNFRREFMSDREEETTNEEWSDIPF